MFGRHVVLWLAVLLGVRLVGLAAYPQIHPDEGFWTQGPRNEVVYCEPLRDGRLHPFLCPGHFLLLSGFFEVAPASLWGGRLFSVLMGVATCGLMALVARAHVPRRPWLVVFLFGLSSLTILIQRLALLEAHQMFWMVLAAWCWLSGYALGPVGAGMAFGMALLVKSNSLYLLPAFVLALPQRERWAACKALAWFAMGCGLVAGGGYLLDWWMDPLRFAAAFRFELQDQDFDQAGALFRVGRFGINPPQMKSVVLSLLAGEPFLPVLALIGVLFLVRHRSQASQAERFFGAWLVLGLCFTLPQIYTEHRYLTTLAPAFAFLAAVALDRWLQAASQTWQHRRLVMVAALLSVFVVFHGSRLVLGVARDGNRAYWQTVDHFRRDIPTDTRVLAASYLVQSLPQTGFEFYRTMFSYDRRQPHEPLAEVVARLGIEVIVIDSEWHDYLDQDIEGFLSGHCERAANFGEFRIFRVR